MNPGLRNSGAAGILTGLALVGELMFTTLSGYNLQANVGPATALDFLREGGSMLRIAALFGAAGVALRTIFVAGLAASLQERAPGRASATLYFGLLGGAGHGLAAFAFFAGVPMIGAMAAVDQAAAAGALGAYNMVIAGCEALGTFLVSLALLAAGWAIVSERVLPASAGLAGLLAATAMLIRIATSGTGLAPVGFVVFFPSLFAAVAFDISAGLALRRKAAFARVQKMAYAQMNG